jgi:hypothetical protein
LLPKGRQFGIVAGVRTPHATSECGRVLWCALPTATMPQTNGCCDARQRMIIQEVLCTGPSRSLTPADQPYQPNQPHQQINNNNKSSARADHCTSRLAADQLQQQVHHQQIKCTSRLAASAKKPHQQVNCISRSTAPAG